VSSGLDVVIVRPWWTPWRSVEMDRETVASVLEPLFGDVSEVRRPVPSGSVVELTWDGRRTGTQWSVYSGARDQQRRAFTVG
jgi:hypothetical protein